MTLLAWLCGLIVLIVAIAVSVAFLSRFYRKTSRDVAVIRSRNGSSVRPRRNTGPRGIHES